MSNIPILDASSATRKVDVITRTEGADTVETQAVAVVDPTNGTPIDFATQATLAALLTAANAIKVAAEALNGKATAMNTGAVAGTVALDSTTLTAMENTTVGGTVAVSNMVAQGLTDAQLRNSAVPVSGIFYQATQPVSGTVALDAPSLAALDTINAAQSGNWSTRTQDGAGNAITSISDGAGQVGLTTAIGATNFIVSANNSTAAQIATGVTFVGPVETIFNQQSISVLLVSDKAGTLTLNQYIDLAGSQKISSWQFPIVGGVPLSRCFVGNGNYFNLTFLNSSGSTTTALKIDTAYGTLPGATNLGNTPMALNEVNGLAFSLGTQAPASSIPVNLSNDVVIGAAASIAALNTDLITGAVSGWYDAANFHSAAIQVIGSAGITAGAITFEQTNDTTAAAAGNVWAVDETTTLTPTPNVAAITIAASTTRMFGGAVTARFVRVRVSTAFATANVQAVAVFSQMPYFRQVQTVHQATAANLNVTASGTVAVTGYPTAAASADALANPTVTKVDATTLAFNGTSWDRVRGMSTALTTGDTGAKVATGNGATITNVGNNGVQVLVNVGVVSGTTPTAVFKLQGSTDGGTSWYDIPGATTASIVATGLYGITLYPGVAAVAGVATTGTTACASGVLVRAWRVVWTIGGTTPSFTITNIQYIYPPH
jgi:hypothetical protein